MAYNAPTICPVCGAPMQVTRLHCQRCDSELSGHFSPCRFCALPEKDLRFIETFLKCRGSIKDVERELGISYPTVRNMLDSALSALGYDAPSEPAPQTADARREILNMLDRGDIDGKEAVQRLKRIGKEEKP